MSLFYSAMHYVEAYLATTNQHLRSHMTRDTVLGRDSVLKAIYSEYQDLKYYGYVARYEMHQFTKEDFLSDAVPQFPAIKDHISRSL